MIAGKRSSLTAVLILVLLLVPMGCKAAEYADHSYAQEAAPMKASVGVEFEHDSVMNFLGQTFDHITQVLGEPDDQGYDEWLGPHYYLLYLDTNGAIRFCSPAAAEETTAVSIILGPGQQVLGVRVGMMFAEIKHVLGEPDFGPERGLNNLYYMGYFFGELDEGVPAVHVSFSALSVNYPTDDAFIKWEGFEYGIRTTVAQEDTAEDQ